MAWFGERMQEGIGMNVAEVNETGGLLRQQVEILPADDFCDPDQATGAPAIPASQIYQKPGTRHRACRTCCT